MKTIHIYSTLKIVINMLVGRVGYKASSGPGIPSYLQQLVVAQVYHYWAADNQSGMELVLAVEWWYTFHKV